MIYAAKSWLALDTITVPPCQGLAGTIEITADTALAPRVRNAFSVAAWVFAVAIMALAPIRSAHAQCEPADDLPGLNGSVHAMVNWDPDGPGPMPPLLAVGGRFTMAGNTPANNIATWNPLTGQWSALGSGMDGASVPEVNALAVTPNGDLVAGGSFDTAGGVAVSNIARWNGSAWSALGTGTGPIYALAALPNGDVVAGGFIGTPGGVVANHVAQWNGTAWSALGAGVGQLGIGNVVYSLALMPNGDVVAGGFFDEAGGIVAHNIARWNGTEWSALGAGTDQSVWALAVKPNGELVASGLFNNAGGVAAERVAVWNGSAWTAMSSGLSGTVLSLTALPNGDVVAGGTFTVADGVVNFDRIARWNGSAWSAMGSGVDGTPFALGVLPGGSGNVVAGGLFTTAGGVSVDHIAAWNGTVWSTLHRSPITASDAAAGDWFGNVAIDGDTIVVGARKDDNATGVDAGAAYVYARSGPPGSEVWTEQATLIGTNVNGGYPGSQSGVSVAISGDTALVGSWLWPNVTAIGAAYVFVRSGPPGGEVWTQQAFLTNTHFFGPNQYFGVSVALQGDTALVGSLAVPGLNAGGEAHFFTRTGPPGGEFWTSQYVHPSDGVVDDQFGVSVAMSPSEDTAVIGAWLEDNGGGFDAGSAYVFTRTGPQNSWVEQAKVTASDGAAYDQFGRQVAIVGDTVVVGSWHDDHAGGADAGSAYVFTRSGSVWTQQAKLTASDTAAGDQFGLALTLSGDTLIVGAYSDDHAGGVDAGSAYVFTRSGPPGSEVWTEQFKLIAPDAAAGDIFGGSVELAGDTAVVGALFDDHAGGTDAGSAYVFDLGCETVACCAGDFDASNDVTTLDIPDFVAVLLAGDACPAPPTCCTSDFNADGLVDGSDVSGFVVKLLGGGACP